MSVGLLGPQASAQQGLHGAQAEEWLISATIAANVAANTITAATIQRQAAVASQTQVFCPVRELWHMERIYFVGTNPSPDVQIQILVDFVPQPYTPLASSVNLTQNRPAALARTIMVPSGSVASVNEVNIAANGASPLTVTFKVQVMRFGP